MAALVALAAGALVGIGLWLMVGALAGWQILPTREYLAGKIGRASCRERVCHNV